MPNFEQVDYDPFAAGDLQSFEPSTAPQRELWLGSLLGGDDANRAFNECLILRLEGKVSAVAMTNALQALAERHEALRGTFSPDGESFLVAKPASAGLREVDLSELSSAERARQYELIKQAEVTTAFDLELGPLFRATLVRLAADSYRFLFSAHHVVCDGWSAGILMIELSALYRAAVSTGDARTAKLPPATSFSAYSSAQQARERSLEGQADVEFWLQHLRAPLPVLDLPTDRPRPEERTYASKRIDIEMGPELTQPLRQLGAKNGCTMLVTFISAMQTWVYRKTQQPDVVFGVPAAGQVASGEQSLVGHCVHLLPIRGQLEAQRTFIEHLKVTKRAMLDCFDHQQVTYSTLLPKLRIPHDPSRVALVPMCVNIDVGLDKLDFGGPDVEYETIPRCFESFEFFINAVDLKTRLVLECSFNTSLFDEATIRLWISEFFALVREVCAAPQTQIAALTSVSPGRPAPRLPNDTAPAQSTILLNGAAGSHSAGQHSAGSHSAGQHSAAQAGSSGFEALNDTAVTRLGIPVHDHFRNQAAKSPAAEAVRFEGRSLSYAELERTSNQFAHVLLTKGVQPGDCVGVCIPRSEHLLTVLLGVLKAGAAYVPMDPGYPKARLQAMADDGKVKLVVGDLTARDNLPAAETQLFLDAALEQLASQPEKPPETRVHGRDRAYVLFTSGSTGRPKGVDVPHSAFENVLEAIRQEPGFSAGERLLAVTTISFDIAGVELFLPLICGGTVVLCSAEQTADPFELKAMLERERIDYMQATPATWTMLLDSGWTGSPTLRVVSTGEAFPPELAKPLLARAGGGVWNLYGPTETTVYSSIKKVQPGQRVTIGRPLDNTQFYILNEAMQPVAAGEVGELWIGGDGVTNGYIGRPELTEERFVPDPFRLGHRMYKSGDLARLNEDGEVECLGRIDFQVKVRGFRIELGEIEAAIAEQEGVRRSVVDVRELGEGDQRIVAYVVPQAGVKLDPVALLRHLSGKLTPYMLPQHVVLVDNMPTTPNGKVDRKALALLSLTEKPDAPAAVATIDDGTMGYERVEEGLKRIWRELLHVDTVSVNSSFFDLGGHSMLAVRMVSRIRESFKIELPLKMVFKLQTVEALAHHIVQALPAAPAAVAAQAGTDSDPAPTVNGGHGDSGIRNAATNSTAGIQPGDAQAKLIEIWKELLQVNTVDPKASFFDLGGHSMLAVRMLSRIRASLGIEIPLRVVFKEQTVEKLATWLSSNRDGAKADSSGANAAPNLNGAASQSKPQLEEIEF